MIRTVDCCAVSAIIVYFLCAFFACPSTAQGGCLVVVVDRRLDPVTPLLSQWTYQAMVHELFGIHFNRVDARQVEAFQSTGLGEVTLSARHDDFLRTNRRKNYGDACVCSWLPHGG